jgi:hypothetical protein
MKSRSYFVGSHDEAQQERARFTLVMARRRATRKGGYKLMISESRFEKLRSSHLLFSDSALI